MTRPFPRRVVRTRRNAPPVRSGNLEKDPDSLSAWVGQRIAIERVARGMSQQSLADAVGLSRTQVVNTECGLSDIPISRFLEYCDALGCTADELLKGYW